jgi:hypothetical protein
VGSGFDDLVYWHFFTIIVNYNSSHIELLMMSVLRISMKDLYEESLTNLRLISDYYCWIHGCTAFYNCHATGIEVTMSNSSSILLCCHGNAFVNVHCCGNKCLPSSCLAKITSTSAIIPAFRQCSLSRCLVNCHILSQYIYCCGTWQGVVRGTDQHDWHIPFSRSFTIPILPLLLSLQEKQRFTCLD